MIGYRRLNTRFMRHWDKMRLFYERGLINRPKNYSELAWRKIESPKIPYFEPTNDLLHKFYLRYPDVKYTVAKNAPGTVGKRPVNPALTFITRQQELIDQGYSENKSFELVEGEMAKEFDREREENRILRGFALNNRARSYLNYSQQLAEVEGRAKVQQLQRDLNKYEEQESKWQDLIHNSSDKSIKDLYVDGNAKDTNYETAEEYFSHYVPSRNLNDPVVPRDYQPVLYEIVKNPKKMKNTESLIDIQSGFVSRTENLIKAHRHRASLTDGLKGLSDNEIVQKIREVPTKIQRNTKSLVKRLEKLNVTLKEDGSVDYSQIPYPHVVKSLKKMDTLVRTALMQQDLKFEYPHLTEKLKIKGEMLKIINAEERKLERIESYLNSEVREIQESEGNYRNYEQYFGSLVKNEVKDISQSKERKKLAYREKEEPLLFENDLLEKSHVFQEDEFEREKRLRELWLDLKRKNIIGGPDARTTNEQMELQELIVDKIRDVRWKIDQDLVKQNLDPLFKKAYGRYTQDQFMLDADIQFTKLKAFLDKNPRILKEDFVIGQEYGEIINLIRRKKLLEYTSPAYSREHEETFDEQKERISEKSRMLAKKLMDIEEDELRLQSIDDDVDEVSETKDPSGISQNDKNLGLMAKSKKA